MIQIEVCEEYEVNTEFHKIDQLVPVLLMFMTA